MKISLVKWIVDKLATEGWNEEEILNLDIDIVESYTPHGFVRHLGEFEDYDVWILPMKIFVVKNQKNS